MHQASQLAFAAMQTAAARGTSKYLKPVTNSSCVLFCSVSEKFASFFTAKLSTDSLVSCCSRPWATRGGCNPCTTQHQAEWCLFAHGASCCHGAQHCCMSICAVASADHAAEDKQPLLAALAAKAWMSGNTKHQRN